MSSSFRLQPTKGAGVIWSNVQIIKIGISGEFSMSKLPDMNFDARDDRKSPDFTPTNPGISGTRVSVQVIVNRGGNRNVTG